MDIATIRPFSVEDFSLRAARERGPFKGDLIGDHLLNPGMRQDYLHLPLRDAAVLIGVVDRDEGANVILTQRNANMRSHSGQVSFPGGRIDPTDATPEDAALRETHEEIGIGPEKIRVVGRMPDYLAGSGYRIAPVLAVVDPDCVYTLNPDEVDAAFEVPLAFLMDPANHHMKSRVFKEKERHFYEMPFGERYIWGLTAGIIHTLYQRLYA